MAKVWSRVAAPRCAAEPPGNHEVEAGRPWRSRSQAGAATEPKLKNESVVEVSNMIGSD